MELVHAIGERGARSLNQQVNMVGHQAVGQTAPLLALDDAVKAPEIDAPVEIVAEDQLAPITAGNHVLYRIFIVESQRARHMSDKPTGAESSLPLRKGDLTGAWHL
jgi:hypothetical protein